MRIELINGTTISSDPIRFPDYIGKSNAEYYAENNEGKEFFCHQPDKGRTSEPRCDYMLIGITDDTVRFIELKGSHESNRQPYCENGCVSTWNHGFHQLLDTYEAYILYIDMGKDIVSMILCTSRETPYPSARYKHYPQYKKIRERGIPILILYAEEIDYV